MASTEIKLPDSLGYPITIIKRLVSPGDNVVQHTQIFSYKYWTTVTENPDLDDEDIDVPTQMIENYESPIEGVVGDWHVYDGDVIHRPITVLTIEEPCAHAVQFGGMCAQCGKDLTFQDYSGYQNTTRASVTMFHNTQGLTVSMDEARKIEKSTALQLLEARKLILVVDLDQTVIHTTVDPTVGEWKQDPNNPNYDAVREVVPFCLDDAAGGGYWHYVKLRPGLDRFLEKIAGMYELHIYTMATRAYARAISKIIDPTGKYFGDRILSRDESGNLEQKSLQRLFPVDTSLVCIIDDRGDVWKWSDNLIKVIPYEFFVGIGDINSSFLPKRYDGSSAAAAVAAPPPVEEDDDDDVDLDDISLSSDSTYDPDEHSDLSTLGQLMALGGGDKSSELLAIQTEERKEALETQQHDRPLARKQSELENAISKYEHNHETESPGETQSPAETPSPAAPVDEPKENMPPAEPPVEQPPYRHNLLVDNDRELDTLEKVLTRVHHEYYSTYSRYVRNNPVNSNSANWREGIPDIKSIMPRMKNRVLQGVVIVFSGTIPLNVNMDSVDIVQWARSFGAIVVENLIPSVTHLIAERAGTKKVRQAHAEGRVKIVTPAWLYRCVSTWTRLSEDGFALEIPPDEPPAPERPPDRGLKRDADADAEDDVPKKRRLDE
ncbi:uncharacterized protein V1510DRAFT_362099 [Dipodascopsis tothii]|uniref:uncharacterized protein n=1 Tax=Dipodascopsis tothii TaxID=44089 RepID=UPI0034CD2832